MEEGELIVRGGCVLGVTDWWLPYMATATGMEVHVCDDSDRAEIERVLAGSPTPDAVLLHECQQYDEDDLLLYQQAARQGTQVVSFCGCRGLARQPGLASVASTVTLPPEFHDVGRGISRALLERKAWLMDRG